MKRLAASMLLVAFSSNFALAQNTPTPSAPALQTAAAADAPSESHIAAAIDLLKATHTGDNMKAMLDVIAPIQTQVLKRMQPQPSDAMIAVIEQQLREIVLARQDEFLRIYATVYAQHFSEQELHDLTAFYRSEVGQKYITAIPSLIKESSPIVTQWMAGVAAQVQEKILQSLPKPPENKS